MKKRNLIILIVAAVVLVLAVVGVTLYFTIWHNTDGPQKTNLNNVITITEVNGNEVNDEKSVLNKIVDLHSEITDQDVKIKEKSFIPADEYNPGAAIIAAEEESNFWGEVSIKITALSEKIDLSKENLEYQAHVIFMNKINGNEATTIKTELRGAILDKMNHLNLEENVDYQISNNLNDIKEDDHLNDYINKITVDSLPNSEKATGTLTVIIKVEENITNREVNVEIDKNEQDDLSAESAGSILRYIDTQIKAILTKGQMNQIGIDYQVIGLEKIKEHAKFDDYYNQVSVKGTSAQLTGEFWIIFTREA